MTYAAYFILGFLILQLLVAFANVVFSDNLKLQETDSSDVKLSVLIPARNEENNIGNVLSDLSKIQNNIVEILVYNDHSEDKTEEIIQNFTEKDHRIKLISAEELPQNWLGKNFACHQLSLKASGAYFLFLDADIRIKSDLIENTLQYAQIKDIDLLSIFPEQKMKTFSEKITVPNMHYILLSLLPLPLVKLASGFPSLAAANGQFMLMKSKIYKKYLPHLEHKNSRAEDIEIARFLKKQGKNVTCLTGISHITCRMYHNLNEAIEGFTKNVTFFFGKSHFVALVFWFITTLGFVPLWCVLGLRGIAYFVVIQILIRIFVSIKSRQNILENVLFMPLQQVLLGVFIFKSIKNKFIDNLEWKGRKI